MNRRQLRKKHGVKEKDRCYLCNNKGQKKCSECNYTICNDCYINRKCYKCDANNNFIELDKGVVDEKGLLKN